MELLIVVAILPLLIGGISVALISVISQQNTASNKTTDSGDADIVAANFVKDVQSSAMVTTDPSPTLSPSPCDASVGTPILSLQVGDTGNTITSYIVVPLSTPSYSDLYRTVCQNGTLISSTIVSHDVQNGLSALIGGQSCDPLTPIAPCNSSPQWSTGWFYANGVTGVSINVHAQLSNYSFTLTGAPRVTSGASRGNTNPPGFPPLLTLPNSSAGVTCKGGGSSGGLSVTGTAVIDSTANPAVQTTGGDSVSATQLYTGAPTNPNPLSGNITPNPPTGQATASDPFAGLAPPLTGLLTATLTPGTTYDGWNVYGGTYSGPGIYTSQLSSYPDNPEPFASGLYILMQGIKDNNTQGITSAAGGVLLYVVQGAIDLEGQGGVLLSPLTTAPAIYANAPNPWPGIVIWQDGAGTQSPTDPGDNTTLKLTGGSKATTLTGTIYAPDAAISGGGGATLNANAVVAQSVTCSGGGNINIGG